jgi:hypothetical protein
VTRLVERPGQSEGDHHHGDRHPEFQDGAPSVGLERHREEPHAERGHDDSRQPVLQIVEALDGQLRGKVSVALDEDRVEAEP